jgi:hypothetical protein
MQPTESKPAEQLGYEPSDANARTLVAWALGLFFVLVLSGGATVLFFDAMSAYARHHDPPVSPLAASESVSPPEPRLLENEPQDVASVRHEEDQVLETYDWVDKSRGAVRVPVERALELVAKEGLPSRAAGRKTP